MPPEKKFDESLSVPCTTDMKRQLKIIADQKGENLATLVRKTMARVIREADFEPEDDFFGLTPKEE